MPQVTRVSEIVRQLMDLLERAKPGQLFHPDLGASITWNDPNYIKMLNQSGYLSRLTPSHVGKLYDYAVSPEFTDLRGLPRLPVEAETYRGLSLPNYRNYPSLQPRIPQSFSLEEAIGNDFADPADRGDRAALMTLMPQGNPNRMIANPLTGLSEFILPASARLKLLGSKLAGTEPGEVSRYLYTRMPGEARGGRISRNRGGCAVRRE